ncbi:poly polymerase catalytic domain-containing protein [Sphaerosporella brunnea]|uniref:Poly [ADP-ribose] polymerase n=1 Tax=Sphaerosporella brunnea TaxID=1250544 RepID=A0A5J5F705_9PEZI|nr:poly polymerase catalytic domain-containing protein [Sphaerosporella brunnea]
MSKLLASIVVVVSGSHKGHTQPQIERLVKKHGGAFGKAVDEETTHLISNAVDVAKGPAKVKQAQEKNIHIVTYAWLEKSIDNGVLEPEKEYAIDPEEAAAAASQTMANSGVKRPAEDEADDKIDAAEEPEPASKKAKATDGTARPKRSAAKQAKEDRKEEEEEDKAPPAARPKRGAKKAVAPVKDKEAEEEKPIAKTAKGRGRAKAAKNEEKDEAKEEDEEKEAEEEKPKAKATRGKGKAKAKAEEEPEEEKEEEVKMKTVVKKGKAPVDECSGLQNSHHVYVDEQGVAWDATLNQTNIGANNNKFYYIQLLERDDRSPNGYATFCHWGRVGERGQSQTKVIGVPLATAKAQFDKLMKSKSGKSWAQRSEAYGIPGKYSYLERNYEDDEDEDDTIKPKDEGPAPEPAKSQLSEPLQKLMQLIFNTNFMQQSMASLSYDSKKLPLGKLSKTTIMQGYEVLKKIGEVIANPTTAAIKYDEYGNNVQQILASLSSQYYTVIPHDFGRRTPPSINDGPSLKKETQLVEALVDMKISSEIIKDSATNAATVNPIDNQYHSLGLNSAEAINKSSAEFTALEAYVKKTHGKTHGLRLQVEEIFKVRRSVEEDRWQTAGWHQLKNDNRKLLWHGSRTTNFGGILSQGLRIAPPEAPVNGYMFDKGIYLADIVSKSANYCCASQSANTGLLLLCEAQLGDPMLELTNAAYDAATRCKNAGSLATKGIGRTQPSQWEDAGKALGNPELEGVLMPKVSGKETDITKDVNPPGAYLQYNEYIVYDISQVKIRYLFRCKFN